jgi:hypothetical protein
VAATQALGPTRAPLLPRGTEALATLIGRQPHLLDQLLNDFLSQAPERADALDRWIAELDAWQKSMPQLK